MAANVLVDTGFLVAILTERDTNHRWAATVSGQHPPPWRTCEAALSETFYLLGGRQASSLAELLRRGALTTYFRLNENLESTLALMRKYADVPMSFADACLVRMTEICDDPVLLTTDADFRVYRRHSRQAIPCVLPA